MTMMAMSSNMLLANYFWLILCAVILYAVRISNKNKVKAAISKGNSVDLVLKHDNKEKNTYLVIAILLTVYSSGKSLSAYMNIHFIESVNESLKMTIYISTIIPLILYLSLTVYAWSCFVGARRYLDVLKKEGYIVPDDAKTYAYSKENLVTKNDIVLGDRPAKDPTCVIESFIMLGIFAAMLIYDLYFFLSYKALGDSDEAITLMMFLGDCFWIIIYFVYKNQSNNMKYMNKNEEYPGLKKRISVTGTVFLLLIFVPVTFFAKASFKSMALYVFRSGEDINESLCDFVCYTMKATSENQGGIPDNIREELTAGANITEWEADDEFKQAFIENCYYSSYGEIEDELKNVKQNENPGIIVTYDGENFSAEVVGVYSREDLPGGGE